MNRKNMDDIFRDGLKNHTSEIDPNEIWAGIQDKKPNPVSDSKTPFTWWILGTLVLMISATVLLSNIATNDRAVIETFDARVTNRSILNSSSASNGNSTETIKSTKGIATNTVLEQKTTTNAAVLIKNEVAVNSKKALNADIKKRDNEINAVNIENTIPSATVLNNYKKNTVENNSTTNFPENNLAPIINSTTITIEANTISNPIKFKSNNSNTSYPIKATPKTVTKKAVAAIHFLEQKEVIPILPMTDEAEENTAIPDVSVPQDKIAEGCYGQPPFSIAVGAHIAPDLVNHNISSTDQAFFPYVDERRATEKLLESYHGGLDVYVQHKSGLFLRSGVEYAQINKRFLYSNTWEQGDSLFTREKKTTNRYRLIDIPLTIGYEFPVNSMDLTLYIEAGASMNVLFKKKGDVLNPILTVQDDYEPISISDDDAVHLDTYLDDVGLSILGGIGIRYELMDGLFLYAQPAGKLYLNSFTKENSDFSERFSRVGLNFGAIYKLN